MDKGIILKRGVKTGELLKCTCVVQVKVHWRAAEVIVIDFLVARKVGNFWNRELIIRLSKRVLLCEDG